MRVTREEFDRSVTRGVTLVDFDAPWCAPCRAQKAIIDALKMRYRGKAEIREIDIEENPDLGMRLGIQSIPTLILFKEGCELSRFIGCQPRSALEEALRAALS